MYVCMYVCIYVCIYAALFFVLFARFVWHKGREFLEEVRIAYACMYACIYVYTQLVVARFVCHNAREHVLTCEHAFTPSFNPFMHTDINKRIHIYTYMQASIQLQEGDVVTHFRQKQVLVCKNHVCVCMCVHVCVCVYIYMQSSIKHMQCSTINLPRTKLNMHKHAMYHDTHNDAAYTGSTRSVCASCVGFGGIGSTRAYVWCTHQRITWLWAC